MAPEQQAIETATNAFLNVGLNQDQASKIIGLIQNRQDITPKILLDNGIPKDKIKNVIRTANEQRSELDKSDQSNNIPTPTPIPAVTTQKPVDQTFDIGSDQQIKASETISSSTIDSALSASSLSELTNLLVGNPGQLDAINSSMAMIRMSNANLNDEQAFEQLQETLIEIREKKSIEQEEQEREAKEKVAESLGEKLDAVYVSYEEQVEERIKKAIEEAGGDEEKLALLLAGIKEEVADAIADDVEEKETEALEKGEGSEGGEVEEKGKGTGATGVALEEEEAGRGELDIEEKGKGKAGEREGEEGEEAEEKGGRGGRGAMEEPEEKEHKKKEHELEDLVGAELEEGELPPEEVEERVKRRAEKEAKAEIEEEKKELGEIGGGEELEKVGRTGGEEEEKKGGKGGKRAMKEPAEIAAAREAAKMAKQEMIKENVNTFVDTAVNKSYENVIEAIRKENMRQMMQSAEMKAAAAIGIAEEKGGEEGGAAAAAAVASTSAWGPAQDVGKFTKEEVEMESRMLAQVLDRILAALEEYKGGEGQTGSLGALVAFEQIAGVDLEKVRPEVLDWMIETLTSQYEKEQNLFVKKKMLKCLGEVLKKCDSNTREHAYVRDIFEKALKHPYAEIREAALEALGETRGDWSREKLGGGLEDVDFGVRHQAIRSFAKMFEKVGKLLAEGKERPDEAEEEKGKIAKSIVQKINVIGEWVGKELNSKVLVGEYTKQNLEVRVEILDLLKEVGGEGRAILLLSKEELAELEGSIGALADKQVLIKVAGGEESEIYDRIMRETKRQQLYLKVAAMNAMVQVRGKRDEKAFALCLYMLESEEEETIAGALDNIGRMRLQFKDDMRVVAALLKLGKRRLSPELRELLEFLASLYNVKLPKEFGSGVAA